MKKLLPICMFLLIFSPKIGGTIDSLSLFCVVVFTLSFLIDNRLSFSQKVIKPTILFLLFGFSMIVYASILKSMNGIADNYQVLRFGRVVINILGVFGLVRLYLFFYKNQEYSEKMIFHLWLCIIAHGFLMVVMFAVPAVNQFVITQLVQLDESNRSFETRILGQRIGGLTSSWDAASGLQSLGILLLPFVFNYKRYSRNAKRAIYLTIPLSLVAVFISGVTGLVTIAVVGFVLGVINVRYLWRYIGRIIKLSFIFTLLVLPIFLFLKANADEEWVRSSSIGRTLFMITQDKDLYHKSTRASTADETVERISSGMYFLPTDDQVLLWGKGGSGRSNDYLIKADPGPTLNLHNLGIFFVLIVYPYCAWMVVKAVWSSHNNLYLGMALTSILMTILIVDAKVMYLFARQSFSIMLIAYYALHGSTSTYRKKQISTIEQMRTQV